MPITATLRIGRNVLKLKEIRRVVEQAQLDYAAAVSGLYLETVETFSGDHGTPTATPLWTERGETKRTVNIYIRGGYRQIYIWLDQGHERTFAMEKGFVAKTSPGFIGSGPGRGGVARSAKSGAPRILPKPRWVVARRFTENIANYIKDGNLVSGYYDEALVMPLRRHLRNRGTHTKTYGGNNG